MYFILKKKKNQNSEIRVRTMGAYKEKSVWLADLRFYKYSFKKCSN